MAQKRRPGSKKGAPKPIKRKLDPAFHRRLNAAMQAKGWTAAALARHAGCTRAAIGKHLKGESKAIEAPLLFELADELDVSPRWLLRNSGPMTASRVLDPDQERVLNAYALLDAGTRDYWMSQAEELRLRQPALKPTESQPYQPTPKSRKPAKA